MGKFACITVGVEKWACLLGIITAFAFAGLNCSPSNKSAKTVKFPDEPPKYPMYDEAGLEDERRWTVYNVHDPAIGKDGDFYYLFSTDVRVGGPARAGYKFAGHGT